MYYNINRVWFKEKTCTWAWGWFFLGPCRPWAIQFWPGVGHGIRNYRLYDCAVENMHLLFFLLRQQLTTKASIFNSPRNPIVVCRHHKCFLNCLLIDRPIIFFGGKFGFYIKTNDPMMTLFPKSNTYLNHGLFIYHFFIF